MKIKNLEKEKLFPASHVWANAEFSIRRRSNFNGGCYSYRRGDSSLPQFKYWLYFHSQFMALFRYNDTATVIRAMKKEEKKCPWSLVLASTIPALDLEGVCSQKFCLWPWPGIFFDSLVLALASNVVSSNPRLL